MAAAIASLYEVVAKDLATKTCETNPKSGKFAKVFKNLPSVAEIQKKMKQLVSAVEYAEDTEMASFTHVHTKIHGYFANYPVLKDEVEDLMATRGKAIKYQKKKNVQLVPVFLSHDTFNIYLFN